MTLKSSGEIIKSSHSSNFITDIRIHQNTKSQNSQNPYCTLNTILKFIHYWLREIFSPADKNYLKVQSLRHRPPLTRLLQPEFCCEFLRIWKRPNKMSWNNRRNSMLNNRWNVTINVGIILLWDNIKHYFRFLQHLFLWSTIIFISWMTIINISENHLYHI